MGVGQNFLMTLFLAESPSIKQLFCWLAMTRALLVGGLEHQFYCHTLGISSSQLTNSYFSEGWLSHQPVVMNDD